MQNSKKNPFLTNKSCQESFMFFILSIALFIYSLTKHYGAVKLEWKMSPYLFPVLISIFLFFLSISLFSDGLRQIKQGSSSVCDDVKVSWKKLISAIVACMVYIIIMPIVTFIPSTILFIGFMLYLLEERRKIFVILLSTLVSVIIYILFSVLLNVMLP